MPRNPKPLGIGDAAAYMLSTRARTALVDAGMTRHLVQGRSATLAPTKVAALATYVAVGWEGVSAPRHVEDVMGNEVDALLDAGVLVPGVVLAWGMDGGDHPVVRLSPTENPKAPTVQVIGTLSRSRYPCAKFVPAGAES